MPRGGKRSTSFKPGQSGNPGGRPKHITSLPPEAKAVAIQAIADVREAAKAETPEMLNTLFEIAKDKTAPPAARVNAATHVLDRGWGKPKETIEATVRTTLEDLVLASMRPRQEDEARESVH